MPNNPQTAREGLRSKIDEIRQSFLPNHTELEHLMAAVDAYTADEVRRARTSSERYGKLRDRLRDRRKVLAYFDNGGMYISNPKAERAEIVAEIQDLENELAHLTHSPDQAEVEGME